jgi:hypothetical protein
MRKRIYNDARTYPVSTSLREVDIDRLQRAADREGVSRAEWMRRAILFVLGASEVAHAPGLTPEEEDEADKPFE